jgi:hypothetical protein
LADASIEIWIVRWNVIEWRPRTATGRHTPFSVSSWSTVLGRGGISGKLLSSIDALPIVGIVQGHFILRCVISMELVWMKIWRKQHRCMSRLLSLVDRYLSLTRFDAFEA